MRLDGVSTETTHLRHQRHCRSAYRRGARQIRTGPHTEQCSSTACFIRRCIIPRQLRLHSAHALERRRSDRCADRQTHSQSSPVRGSATAGLVGVLYMQKTKLWRRREDYCCPIRQGLADLSEDHRTILDLPRDGFSTRRKSHTLTATTKISRAANGSGSIDGAMRRKPVR